jgi:hypothetical protein
MLVEATTVVLGGMFISWSGLYASIKNKGGSDDNILNKHIYKEQGSLYASIKERMRQIY